MVLSMSKRIMNEVICTAEDLNIPVFYQDTDSIHINQSRLDKLAKEFKRIKRLLSLLRFYWLINNQVGFFTLK